MITFLPSTPVFYMDTCETGCYYSTTHRLDQFAYDIKRHKVSFRICCTECEDYAREAGTKFPVHYVTFNKKDWIQFAVYLGLVESDN